MEQWLTATNILALGGMLGVGAVLKTLVDYFLKRRDTRETQRGDYDKARLDDSAALRSEVWTQFRAEQERSSKLSRDLGESIQAQAQAQARATTLQEQVTSLASSLAGALRDKEEAVARLARRVDEYDMLRATHSDVLEKLDASERHTRNLEAEVARQNAQRQ